MRKAFCTMQGIFRLVQGAVRWTPQKRGKTFRKGNLKMAIKKKTNKTAIDYIDQIHKEQEVWKNTVYKSANDKLLALLSKCLEAYKMLAAEEAKVRKAFYAKLEALGYENKSGAHLTTKLVTYVFRVKGGRADVYARVLRAALEANVEPAKLAGWVQDKGGIEAVRRERANGANGVATEKHKQQKVQAVLEAGKAIATLSELPDSLHRNVSTDHDFSVALVRHNSKTGEGEVVLGCNNAALVRAFFNAVGKQVLELNKNAKQAATVANKRAKVDDAVQNAVAASINNNEGGEQKQAA